MRAPDTITPFGTRSAFVEPAAQDSAAIRRSRTILGVRVDVSSYQRAEAAVARWVQEPVGRYVCVCSVHPVMEAHDDPKFKDILNRADLVTADGMPLVWAQRLLGAGDATRVYGPDLTLVMCAWAASCDVPIGLYGSKPEVIERLSNRLKAQYPRLRIDYRYSPPFRTLTTFEREEEIRQIRDSGIRLLFVGLGCPKQERWMADRRDGLDVVMFGVGAAFDYLAGTLPQPPAWMQRSGLEWLFRLIVEPRRLWKRYLRNNPRFLCLFARQYARYRRAGGN